MFRFYKVEYFILVIFSIGFLIYILRSFYAYKEKILSIFSENLIYRITKNYRIEKVFTYILLSSITLILLSIGIMAPQFGKKIVDVKKRGLDIIIALDVSRSMLAQDIVPSRLERAKLELSNFISSLKGDRVGVVLFAGQAFVQVPLTTDYDAARLFLKNVGVDSVPVQGTNFRAAFQLAKEIFINNQESSGAKVLLLLTDGEDHEGNYEQIIEEFKALGIRVYAIGIGTMTGEPIPESSDSVKGYKKDKSGQIVVSRLNEGLLKKVTSSTGGVYIQGSSKDLGVPLIIDELRGLKKGEITTKEVYEYLDRYYIFAFLSLIILVYTFFVVPFRKYSNRVSLFILCVLSVLYFSGFSPFLRENPETKRGNEYYQNGKYSEAIKSYDEALEKLKNESLVHFNKANALTKEKKYNEAYDEYRKAIVGADDKLKSKIYFNMGNLFLEQQKYQEAIDSYIKSIQFDREFLDPKHNLEMVLRMMKQENKEQQQDKKDEKKEEKKEEEKREEAKEQDNKENEKPQNQEEKRDIAKAEQLLNSLKDKETEQPFNKFLLKEFSNTDVEKDW